MKARVREGQSLVDMALVLTGATEGAWALAIRNGLGLTDALRGEETVLEYLAEDVEDASVVKHYAQEGIVPATAVAEGLAALLLKPEEPEAATEIEELPTAPANVAVSIFGGEFEGVFGKGVRGEQKGKRKK